MAQFDIGGQFGILAENGLGIGQGRIVDIDAEEGPAVFGMADQRIDQVGAGADVEDADAGAGRDGLLVAGGEQVGQRCGCSRRGRESAGTGSRPGCPSPLTP